MAGELAIPALDIHAILSARDVAAFLDMAGPPADFTLRPEGAAAPLDGALMARLAVAGLAEAGGNALSPDGARIAATLLAPECLIELAIWNEAQSGNMAVAFPAGPAGGSGIVFNRDGDRISLGGWVDDAAIVAMIEPLLAPLTATAPSQLEVQLDTTRMTVLAALVDMAAIDGWNGATPPAAVSDGYVSEWLSIGWGAAARASLCGQVFALTLAPEPPSPESVAAALADFDSAGLVTLEENGHYRPTSALAGTVRTTAVLTAGFDLRRLERRPDRSLGGAFLDEVERPAPTASKC